MPKGKRGKRCSPIERAKRQQNILSAVKQIQEEEDDDKIVGQVGGWIVLAKDMKRLLGTKWIDDSVIDNYFRLIERRSISRKRSLNLRVVASRFVDKLKTDGYACVRKWVQIFDFDMVLIPYCFQVNKVP